jgi:tripartite-type tricarboxylate transporter receptor subunit TctC
MPLRCSLIAPIAAMVWSSTCGSVFAAQANAGASVYPVRPIRFIVPFAAGGGPDLTARVLGAELSRQMGQQLVIDNRAGAGGSMGTELIVRAIPDGYTIGYGSISSLAINPSLLAKPSFDALNDTQKVTIAYYAPNLLAVSPTLPVKSVKELIDYAKSNPGKLSFASNGNGTSGHLTGELFKNMTATQMVHVPYKAAQQVITDLMGGQVQVTFNNIGPLVPHVKAGRLRGLAVTGPKRSPAVPELPAVAETIPGFEATVWAGVVTPRGVPKTIVAMLQTEINKALALPAVTEKFAAMGYEPGGGTAEAFEIFAKKEAVKWADVVRRSGVKAD